MIEKNVVLLPHQMEFVLSDEKFVLLSGGIGSGKSHAGAHFVIRMITEFPNCRGFIGANSYKQLHNATLLRLKAELVDLGMNFHHNSLTGILTIEGVEVFTGTLENGSYNNHRGIEVGWVWCDETRDLEEEAWQMLTGRLRDKNGPLIMRGTTSPSGFNWLYDHWVGEKKTQLHRLISNVSSHNNIFLPEGYVEAMAATYDELFYKQEVEGQFVNLTAGKVYRSYNPDINDIDFDIIPTHNRLPILIGMDFNVAPMTAVVGRLKPGGLYIFDEIWLNDANTYQMADEIKKRYGDWKCPIVIYPDHTGAARKTSAFMSDHQILKKSGFIVKTSQNPLSQDRYNSVNGLLDHAGLMIHKRCKMLRRDLQQVVHEKNANHLTHISDALGYLVVREFPVISKSEQRIYQT